MVSPPPDVGNKPTLATAARAVITTAERGAPPPGGAVPALDRADIKPLDVPGALQILIAEVGEAFELLLTEAGDTGEPGDIDGAADSSVTGNGGITGNGGVIIDGGTVNDAADASAVIAGIAANTAVAAGAASAGTSNNAGMAAMAGNRPPASVDSPTSAARVLVEMVLQALPVTPDEAAWSEALQRAETSLMSGAQRAVDVVIAWRDVPPIVVQMTRESISLALQVLGDEPQNPLWLRPEWLAMAPRLGRFWRRRRVYGRRLTDPDHDTAARWDETDEYTQ